GASRCRPCSVPTSGPTSSAEPTSPLHDDLVPLDPLLRREEDEVGVGVGREGADPVGLEPLSLEPGAVEIEEEDDPVVTPDDRPAVVSEERDAGDLVILVAVVARPLDQDPHLLVRRPERERSGGHAEERPARGRAREGPDDAEEGGLALGEALVVDVAR